MHRYTLIFSTVLIIFFIIGSTILQAAGSDIKGKVSDANSGEALLGANVILIGTSIGAATDANGNYTILNVPSGTYKIRASYLGYKSKEILVTIKENTHLLQNFKLEPVGVESKTVVVTAQAAGQNAAINQQLNSDNIVNVVSAAKIQELPDANAAESVGRLPGISLLRSGGEGYAVAIRGLEPKFNEITINGVQLSSSNPDNRSTDLSMISSDILEGISVAKTVTPDMDANVIGGVVNFELREARTKTPGVPQFSFLAQGAYNGLTDAMNKYNNYKVVGTIENRFFNDRLGVLVQASYERRNLSSNEQNALYGPYGLSQTQYLIQTASIDDILRDRKRGNGVVSLDYKLSDFGKIKFSNLFSTSLTSSNDRQQAYNPQTGNNSQNFNFIYNNSTLNTIANMLKFQDKVSIFNMTLNLAHSYSETKDPKDWQVNFKNTNAGLKTVGGTPDQNPANVILAATNDTASTILQSVITNHYFTKERILSGALDFETPLNISNDVSVDIKFGGKYEHRTRSFNQDQWSGEDFSLGSSTVLINQLKSVFPFVRNIQGIPNYVGFIPFIDPNFNYGTFLNGKYTMVYPLNLAYLQSMVDYMNSHLLPNNTTYDYNVGQSIAHDYKGLEDLSAAYIMATVNIGQFLQIIPGVRYQQLRTEYTAPQGVQSPTSFTSYPNKLKTIVAYYPRWYPDLLIHYKPMDWLGIRLDYTNTVSYPDYNQLAPTINVYLANGTITYNGSMLKPVTSTNYDAALSFHNNTIGLFTIGGFLKQIKNLMYAYQFFPTTQDLAQYYPDWVPLSQRTALAGIQVTKPVNNPYTANNYGMELEWQTHFWYLPDILSGLVLSVNYTHIFSKTQYPEQLPVKNGRFVTHIDTLYYAPLLYQPDNILNITLGYDYKGLSIRIATQIKSKIFIQPRIWPQLRGNTAAYNRWDINIKQELPINGLSIYCNLDNINSENDLNVISASTQAPLSEQDYGYSIELGLRANL